MKETGDQDRAWERSLDPGLAEGGAGATARRDESSSLRRFLHRWHSNKVSRIAL